MDLEQSLAGLSKEAFELYLSRQVPVLDGPPRDEVEFYRNYVAANRPVIIRNGLSQWPALSKWTLEYFETTLGAREVTVTVTPDGYADAVRDGRFVQPAERRCTFGRFVAELRRPRSDRVFYIQKQCSNLTEELAELVADAAPDLPWATRLFGAKPDAVNFWMGDGRAVTSMHKDPYENMYCVVSGHKDFLLHPPTDLPWIPYGRYRPARWNDEADGSLRVVDDPHADQVPWISVDPLRPDAAEVWPAYGRATPVRCRVGAGDILYLPSLWFHHVRQSHGCIAVNYWYDMQFDVKFNYFQLLQRLSDAHHGADPIE